MERERLLEFLEHTDSTPEEVSSTAVHRVTQMLSDCQEYTSRLNAQRDYNYTKLSANLKEMHAIMNGLSSCIDEIIANGLSSSPSKIGSKCTQNQGCPTYYQKQGFKSIDFIDKVLDDITERYDLSNVQIYSIKDFLKYTIRAGEKDPWEKDAFKTADYIVRCITNGTFLSEMPTKEETNDESKD